MKSQMHAYFSLKKKKRSKIEIEIYRCKNENGCFGLHFLAVLKIKSEFTWAIFLWQFSVIIEIYSYNLKPVAKFHRQISMAMVTLCKICSCEQRSLPKLFDNAKKNCPSELS